MMPLGGRFQMGLLQNRDLFRSQVMRLTDTKNPLVHPRETDNIGKSVSLSAPQQLQLLHTAFHEGAQLLSGSARACYPRHQGSRRCKAARRAGRLER